MIATMGALRWKLSVLVLLTIQVAHPAPLDTKTAEDDSTAEEVQKEGGPADGLESLGLEYEGYLREVIQVLEADPEMKAKMDEMTTDDLLNGKFGKQLNNVGNHIRTQLDDLKRKEIQRLRLIARKQMEQNAGVETDLFKFIAHVDFDNEHTFEEHDLNKLLQKATTDLEENDKERRKEFKRYEMEKELKRRSELRNLQGEAREQAQKEYQEEREKLKHHSKINHPGSKKQLEEVWEKTDRLDRGDFDPKTFFYLHDSNSDGFLDEFELEALFIKEVEKVYQGQKDVDPQEKFEELSRMREHVVNQIDDNKDKMVSLEEFMQAAAAPEFEEDSAWQDINQEDQFTEDDLHAYQEELRKTLEETKAKMAEAGDNFVRVRQPQRQEPVAMDQAAAQKVDAGLEMGQPPMDNKVRFEQEQGGDPAAPGMMPAGQPQAQQQANPPGIDLPAAPGGPPQ